MGGGGGFLLLRLLPAPLRPTPTKACDRLFFCLWSLPFGEWMRQRNIRKWFVRPPRACFGRACILYAFICITFIDVTRHQQVGCRHQRAGLLAAGFRKTRNSSEFWIYISGMWHVIHTVYAWHTAPLDNRLIYVDSFNWSFIDSLFPSISHSLIHSSFESFGGSFVWYNYSTTRVLFSIEVADLRTSYPTRQAILVL